MPVKQIRPRDLPGLLTLANCGHASHAQLISAGMSARRIRSLREDGVIAPVHLPEGSCWRTTAPGRRWLERTLSVDTYQPQSPQHDLTLAEVYLSLTEPERASWEPETRCRRRLGRDTLSAPDGLYVTGEGRRVAVEVVTRNYSAEDIAEKRDAAKALGAGVRFIRV